MTHPETKQKVSPLEQTHGSQFADLAAFDAWLDEQLGELEQVHAEFQTARTIAIDRRIENAIR